MTQTTLERAQLFHNVPVMKQNFYKLFYTKFVITFVANFWN